MRSARKQRDIQALTLVEVLIASGIFIVILGIIYAIHLSGMDIWETGRTQADLQARARLALNNMVSELRSATRSSAQAPSPNLFIPASPNNDEVTFCLPRDLDGDGLITDENGDIEWETGNPVQYQYIPAQNEIRRLDNAGATILARNVADVRFFDINIDPTLAIDEVRMILTLNKATLKRRNITITLSTIAALRN
jgi:type II secretory pathway pseudopilin PulG